MSGDLADGFARAFPGPPQALARHFPGSEDDDSSPFRRRARRRPTVSDEHAADVYGRSPPIPVMQKKSVGENVRRSDGLELADRSRQKGWAEAAINDIPEPTDTLAPENIHSRRLGLKSAGPAIAGGSSRGRALLMGKDAQQNDMMGIDIRDWNFVVAKGRDAIAFNVKGLGRNATGESKGEGSGVDSLEHKKSKLDQRVVQRPRTCGITRTSSLGSGETNTATKQQRLHRIGGSASALVGANDTGQKGGLRAQRCGSDVHRRAGTEISSRKRPTTCGPLGRGMGVDGKVGSSVVKHLVKHQPHSEMSKSQRLENLLELLTAHNGDADKVDPLAFYILGEELGKGAFGSVRVATHVMSGEKVAIKTYDKYKVISLHKNQGQASGPDVCMHEVRLLERLSHRNVITLHQTIQTAKKVHMVLDFVSAGDLANYVKFRSKLPEPEAKSLFKQVLSGLVHCHQNKVTHRDLKMENVMLLEDQTVKIIDFGMGEFTDSGRKLRLQCGTPAYAAPEIWADKSYSGPQADVWSLGVMLYIMLVGKVPFHHPNATKMFELVTTAKFSLPSSLSAAACSFLRAMLTADPKRRATVKSLIGHRWLSDGEEGPERVNVEEGNSGEDEDHGNGSEGDGDDTGVIAEMLRLGFNVSRLREDLGQRKRSSSTVCYKMLRRRHRRLLSGSAHA